jgi:predicted class III extradiol MEMO1 family dioxygenase
MPLYFMSRDHGIVPLHIVVYIVAIHHQINLMYISSDFTHYRQQSAARSALHGLAERICS